MFRIIFISLATSMHIYVFWRIASITFIRQHITANVITGTGFFIWVIIISSWVFGRGGTSPLAATLELLGMNWIGALFLLSFCFLAVDIITAFGFLVPRIVPSLRNAAFTAGVILSLLAIVQGMRPPMIQDHEVRLQGLPDEMNGLVALAVSDTHLGSLIGRDWLEARVAQINGEKPDMVFLIGDIFEGHGKPRNELIDAMGSLSAPLGIWAVTGNHEFHGNRNGNMPIVEGSRFQVLRNRWVEVSPGLILAGVDDLTHIRRSGGNNDKIKETLDGRPPGATILLSHTPWHTEIAENTGVELMLSGHTHGGQIWPFNYLVRLAYPFIEGRYEIGRMTLIVCRGTGTWGPRMRLWRRGEILRITLRAE